MTIVQRVYQTNLRVQIEASRRCTGVMYWCELDPKKLLLELGREPLVKRRNWHKLIYMFRIVHGLSPTHLSEICQPTAKAT